MSRETRPGGTYLRIIESSLQLFNEQGERNVSTNHIANHLGISPATCITISATRTRLSCSCSNVIAKNCKRI